MGLSDAIQFFPKTDQGRVRDLNEDNFLVDRKLALTIVADGMGGHAAGEVASAIAVRIIHQEVKKRQDLMKSYASGHSRDGAREIQQMMEAAVLRACSRVHEEAKADSSKRGMGTTLSALIVSGSHGFVAHVGDSRIYLYRDGKIQQVTEDHTVYNELIRRGRLTREQIDKVAQKNAVTRAVGVYERVDVDTLMLELLPGDQFLVASDGLHGYINHNAELEPYFEDEDGERATTELIELANKKGGKDNITCVMVRIGRADESYAEQARRLAQKKQALRNMPLFSKLQERELLRIMQVAEVLEFEPGEDVVREGDRGDELFIVIEGMLNILRGEQVLSEVGPGEHFGEMALIRSSPRSATVRAVERSELIAIRRADFFAILRKEYELAVKMLWQFLGVLADRLDQTSRDLSTAKEELAAEDISDAIAEDVDDEPRRLSRMSEEFAAHFASGTNSWDRDQADARRAEAAFDDTVDQRAAEAKPRSSGRVIHAGASGSSPAPPPESERLAGPPSVTSSVGAALASGASAAATASLPASDARKTAPSGAASAAPSGATNALAPAPDEPAAGVGAGRGADVPARSEPRASARLAGEPTSPTSTRPGAWRPAAGGAAMAGAAAPASMRPAKAAAAPASMRPAKAAAAPASVRPAKAAAAPASVGPAVAAAPVSVRPAAPRPAAQVDGASTPGRGPTSPRPSSAPSASHAADEYAAIQVQPTAKTLPSVSPELQARLRKQLDQERATHAASSAASSAASAAAVSAAASSPAAVPSSAAPSVSPSAAPPPATGTDPGGERPTR